MENGAKQEVSVRIKARWIVFGKFRNLFGQAPSHKSEKKGHQPVCLTSNDILVPNIVSHTQKNNKNQKKKLVTNFTTSQQAMERKMLNVRPKGRIHNTIIGLRTIVTCIVQYVTNTKWKWAGLNAGMKDNIWTDY